MSKDDKFFQFPIAALYFGKPITNVTKEEMWSRLDDLISYCVVEAGMEMAKGSKDIFVATANRTTWNGEPPHSDEQKMILAGCGLLKIRPGNLQWSSWSKEHGRIDGLRIYGNQHCRLKTDLVFEARDIENDMWSWRDFATLTAVYAAIGGYKYSRITYDRIGAMALGFTGQRGRDQYKAKKNQLSTRQTQYTVKRLEERGFFASVSPNFRNVYYSNKLQLAELVASLVALGKKREAAKPKTLSKQIQERIHGNAL